MARCVFVSVLLGQILSCEIAGSKGIYIFNCDSSCFIVLQTGCSKSPEADGECLYLHSLAVYQKIKKLPT